MNEASSNNAVVNQQTQRSLMILVERVVRPIRANRAKKRRMREELLAHVSEIYDDELESVGDIQQALQNTSDRFGDPVQVSSELQASISRRVRFGALLERWVNFELNGSARWLFIQFCLLSVLTFAAYALAILVTLPFQLAQRRPTDLSVLLRVSAVSSVAISALSTGFFVWGNRIARALNEAELWRMRREELFSLSSHIALPAKVLECLTDISSGWTVTMQRWAQWRAVAWAIASIPIVPVLAFALYWGISGELLGAMAQLKKGCMFAGFAPIILYLVGRQLAREQREREQWASLDIDDPIAGLDGEAPTPQLG